MDVRAHFFRFSLLALLSASLTLAACGGGGGGGTAGPVPAPGGGGGGGPTAAPTGSPGSTPTPSHTPTPGPTQSPSPVPSGNYESPAPASFMRSSYGRIGPMQILDRFFDSNTQIEQEARGEDAVWGAFHPDAWLAGNSNIVNSLYVVPVQDANRISGHDMNWFLQNHPDWILYACDSTGTMTNDDAWMPGSGFPDVVLNFRNPDVIKYQVLQVYGPYMIAHGYNTLAVDNVNFGGNLLAGPNPYLGEGPVQPGWYGCGIRENGTPVTIYSSGGGFIKGDQSYGQDILNWVVQVRNLFNTDPTLAPHHFHVAVNHPLDETAPYDSRFKTLLANIDAIVDENGFTHYTQYFGTSQTGFINRVSFLEAIQRAGKDAWINDYFCDEPGARFPHCAQSLTTQQLGYAMATYLITNLGNARLYANTVGDSYSYHQEYQVDTGPPCGEYSGSYPVYTRKFLKALVVANIENAPQSFNLPAGHTYTDLQQRAVTNPLQLQPHDGWVLQTTNGCN